MTNKTFRNYNIFMIFPDPEVLFYILKRKKRNPMDLEVFFSRSVAIYAQLSIGK
jgi:hypothetical protein